MIMRKERLIIISITEILIAFTLCLHISEQTDKILVLLLVLGFIAVLTLSLIHISEPTRQDRPSRMPSSA